MSKLRNLAVVGGMLLLIFGAHVAATNALAAPVATAPTTTTAEVIESVNINSADAAALMKVKGIGKKKAQAIVEYRNKNGAFKSTDELLKIKCRGVNKKWLDKVNKHVTV